MSEQTNTEYRSCVELKLEKRDDEPQKIVGYAAVFDSLSKDLGGFREKIQRGAFSRSLNDGDEIHALYDHKSDMVLGRRGSGTLRVEEDSHGLRIEIDPPNTTVGRDVVELLNRGDLVSMSFGFFDAKDTWETSMEEGDIRTINSARLFDVSVVSSPAYTATEVGMRSHAEYRTTINPEVEDAAEIIADMDEDCETPACDTAPSETELKLRIAEME